MNLKWRLEDLLVISGWTLWLCLGSQLQNFQTVVPMNELGPPSRIWPIHPRVPVRSNPPLECLAVNSTFNSEHIQWMLNVIWCTICYRISSCSHCRSILGTTCFSRCDNHSANITPSFSELPSCHILPFKPFHFAMCLYRIRMNTWASPAIFVPLIHHLLERYWKSEKNGSTYPMTDPWLLVMLT
jgi:hypothetical protein